MAKQKTKKGWAKRVKKRKSGVITRRKAGGKKNLTSKSKRRKRRLRQPAILSKADRKRVQGLV